VIQVGNQYFRQANVSVAQGATLRWLFTSPAVHNVTVANGPLGFSSRNLSGGRQFQAKLTRPGTYRIFCALHPVSMTATIKVTPRKRK
jgi:plastocyanin